MRASWAWLAGALRSDALALRVEERLGRHLALDPLAEDLDRDAGADGGVCRGQVRVGDRALDGVAVAAARDPADEPLADAYRLRAERDGARVVERQAAEDVLRLRPPRAGRRDPRTSPLSSFTANPSPASNGESSGVMSAPHTR